MKKNPEFSLDWMGLCNISSELVSHGQLGTLISSASTELSYCRALTIAAFFLLQGGTFESLIRTQQKLVIVIGTIHVWAETFLSVSS